MTLAKLQLNDAALVYEPETSVALGFGYRCGFLGLLHMEIVQERLEREFNLDLISTAPSVIYEVHQTDSEIIYVQNPSNLPTPEKIAMIKKAIVNCDIIVPQEYIGAVMEAMPKSQGNMAKMDYIDERRVPNALRNTFKRSNL